MTDASDAARSPGLVLVREPDQLGVQRTHPQLAFGVRLGEPANQTRHVAPDDDRTPAILDDDHLHAACVARRRDEAEPGQQLVLAVDGHVAHAGRLDPLANGVVVLAARVVELATLDVDRLAGEEVVAAAVVEVQVGVDDDVDAGQIEVLRAQWLKAGIEVGHRRVQLRHAGVDQHARIGMVDDVHVDRHPLVLGEQVGNAHRRDGDRWGAVHTDEFRGLPGSHDHDRCDHPHHRRGLRLRPGPGLRSDDRLLRRDAWPPVRQALREPAWRRVPGGQPHPGRHAHRGLRRQLLTERDAHRLAGRRRGRRTGTARGGGRPLRQRDVRLRRLLAGDLPRPGRQPVVAAPPLCAEGSTPRRVVRHAHRMAPVPFTRRNLKQDLEDVGPNFDGAPELEFRLATKALELERSGLSYQRVPPGHRFPYGHTHREQEEVYVVLRGSGRMKLDDEIVELREWDAVRVPPGTWRGYEAGPDGLEIIVIGAPNLGEDPREDVEGRRDWWAD